MNIYFDFEIKEEYKSLSQNPQSKALTDEIRNIIIERLNILSDEIGAEEKQLIDNSETDFAMILINIMQENPSIAYIRYSTSLTNKMIESLGEIWTYVSNRLGRINSRFDN